MYRVIITNREKDITLFLNNKEQVSVIKSAIIKTISDVKNIEYINYEDERGCILLTSEYLKSSLIKFPIDEDN